MPRSSANSSAATETPEWAKQLIEQNKALTDRIAKMEGQRTTDSRKQQLSTIIAKLPEQPSEDEMDNIPRPTHSGTEGAMDNEYS